jgi:tripartite-type tricarboxylate transporter receptor subunit TctC
MQVNSSGTRCSFRQVASCGCALVMVALSGAVAHAQDAAANYPSKPITLIVPYAPGGSSDIRARQVAQKLAGYFGKPVNVENKPGKGGNTGTELIAKAAPDGYTIGLGNFAPLAINRHLDPKMGFDPQKDLIPVALIERGPLLLMVKADSPYKSAKDLVADAKSKPGKLSYASAGSGGAHHLAGEMFKSAAGIFATHIPYSGGAPAVNDLIAGNVSFMFEWITASMPQLKAAPPKTRALAIASSKRSPLLPDVPTFAEVGFKGVEISNWFGIVAPMGTSPAVVNKLNAAINRALKEPDVRDKVVAQGNEIGTGSPELFQAFVAAESFRWGKLVKDQKINSD